MRMLLFALSWVGASLGDAQGTPAGEAPKVEREQHLVVATTGDVRIMRKGWTAYSPVAFGTGVDRGDLLKLGAGASATITCSDLTVRTLPAGKVIGVPCGAPTQPLLVYQGSLLAPTRAAGDSAIPTVIAPRRTLLSGVHPQLRWKPVPGVARYKLHVTGPGVDWSAEFNGTSAAWPSDAPALTPGATYKLSVAAGARNSDELGESGLGFTLLDAASAAQLRTLEGRIRALKLPDEATQLVVAKLYASRGLRAEAIDALEAIVKTRPGAALTVAIAQQYQQVGLSELAEQNLLLAIKQAGTTDLEGLAVSQRALGLLYRDAFGLPADAKQALEVALASYRKLGAAAAVAEVQLALKELDSH